MDPTTLFMVLQPTPVVVDRHAVTWRGGLMPVMLPLMSLPAGPRARIVLAHDSLPLEIRVSTALEAGLTDEAWAMVVRTPGPVTRTVGLDLTLAGWTAHELARLGLPGTREEILVLTANGRPAPGMDPATAFGVIRREVFPALAWPRWVGPVVVVADELAARDPMPGQPRIARPALPMLRVDRASEGITRSELLSVELTRLVLALEAAPATGWPAWLRVGLEEVAKAKVRGEGPSPLKMLAIRQRAGANALAELLLDPTPDVELAQALCAPLVHTKRRHLLSNLLNLLRGGAQSAGAIKLAYGLTLQQLTEER
jgi:hypothetical protein